MKNILLAILLISISSITGSAQFFVPPNDIVKAAPEWAQMMYSDNPNAIDVKKAFRAYYQDRTRTKNVHTKNYKFWKRLIQYRIKSDGTIASSKDETYQKRLHKNKAEGESTAIGNWSLIGPIQTITPEGANGPDQACVYSIDQSVSNSNVVFCGTEPGEVYKSTDGGDSWTNMSLDLELPFSQSAATAIAIHPDDAETVFFSVQNKLYRSTDGGTTWEVLHTYGDEEEDDESFLCDKIFIHPNQPTIMLTATNQGLWRSADGGETWEDVHEYPSFDIELKPESDNIIYTLRINTDTNQPEFLRSTDFGVSFTIQTNGWFTSSDPDREPFGGRIAVSKADPNRVYAYLTGQGKAGDSGYIGLYRSDDGGQTWTLPNGPSGGPYSESHPNLASFEGVESDFFADFSFCALAASDDDADNLLIGGLNLWRSKDGGATFEALGGYIDGPFNDAIDIGGFHVDQQEFKVAGDNTWITNDGGIYKSTDFFSTTDFDKANRGIHSTDFWGFGSGWNKDILIGGVFHNGVMVYNETYGEGEYLVLGGGEPSSGYVNPGDANLVYSTDVGGAYIPDEIGPFEEFEYDFTPNENYDALEEGYSDLVFHPQCYSVAYTGRMHELWRTTDKGLSFDKIKTFGNVMQNFITGVQISRKDPNTMHVAQRLEADDKSTLWKTTDAGMTWIEIDLPSDVFKFMLLQVDPFDDSKIWIASSSYEEPANIYRSENGGSTWINITTPTLDGEYAKTLDFIPGTDSDLYLGTNLGIYYRNNSMNDWIDFSSGLPAVSTAQKSRPFYRDNKLRISSTKGMWESELQERPSQPLAQIMVDRIETCAMVGSEFRFVDHSYLKHEGASWNWIIEGGTASSTSTWFTDVTFDVIGSHNIILEITDDRGLTDRDTLEINIGGAQPSIDILFDQEDCEDFMTSISEIDNQKQELLVSPNPSSGIINVVFQTESTTHPTLKVFGQSGKVIYKKMLQRPIGGVVKHAFDLSGSPSGIYWIQIEDDKHIKIEKVVLN